MLDKHFDPAALETVLYGRWEASGAFAAGKTSGDAPPYTIMIPPPNVTGSLHMGHALTFTVQDVLVRYHRMKGCDTLWQPGTDHAGIATQMVVERQLAAEGLDRRSMGRAAFLERVWQWKAESGDTITKQLRRLGATLDWPRERFTMDEGLSAAVTKVFVRMHKDGLIYRDKRLVNWDPKLQTAISDLEVVQKEQTGSLWYFKYPLADDSSRFITVATTRPETMLGDAGVAVHPEDERYRDLVGKHVRLPLVDRLIPIVADAHADPEKGSGAVKITPAHDWNDFEVGRRHALPMISIFDAEARLTDDCPEGLRGLSREDARKAILTAMADRGLLDKVEDNPMSVPYSDRTGVVVEPYLTDQWFVRADRLARPAIEAVEQGRITFVPENWANTYFAWMRNIQPWCISRQLWWGHRIPAWYGPDGTIFVAEAEADALAQAKAHYGTETALRQDEDVLDTWFSSGLWPFSTLGWPEETPELARHYPTSTLVTGFDIIFFWVARMIMMGEYVMGDVPFRTVYIHALVRDEHGQKMSKSKGNVIDPLDLMDRYGTDALRFTLTAMAAQGRDVRMSEARVEGYRNFATKLWNAARFCQMNGVRGGLDLDPGAVHLPLSRWIIAKTAETARAVTAAFDDYRFNEAANALYGMVWGTFCDWYLEMAKPVFAEGGSAAEETRAVAGWVLDRLLTLLHPIMPFVTEALWQETATRRSSDLIMAPWPTLTGLDSAEARADLDLVVQVVSAVRSLRAEVNVPPAAHAKLLVRDADAQAQRVLTENDSVIRTLARLESLTFLEDNAAPPKASASALAGALALVLPLAGLIDVAAERSRLAKERGKVTKDLDGLNRKLGNPAFLDKAPAEVIAEQERRRQSAQDVLAKLDEALARLEGL